MATFSEYSRLRDIAQKRQKRLVSAGFFSGIHIPTVKELRASGADPAAEIAKLHRFLAGPTTVKSVRQAGIRQIMVTQTLTVQPIQKPKRQRKPLTEAQRARKNQKAREKYALEQAIKSVSAKNRNAIRSAMKLLKRMRDEARGVKIPGLQYDPEMLFLDTALTRDFAQYMEARISQYEHDASAWYQELGHRIEDYAKIRQKGRTYSDIAGDFNDFLLDQAGMDERAGEMSGMSSTELQNAWTAYIGRL